ncbi:MAG: hypothetical protein H6Q61_1222, partial [Firmicutes bacterium]|nr:hypothetical protein [Bacillota bacterium]
NYAGAADPGAAHNRPRGSGSLTNTMMIAASAAYRKDEGNP